MQFLLLKRYSTGPQSRGPGIRNCSFPMPISTLVTNLSRTVTHVFEMCSRGHKELWKSATPDVAARNRIRPNDLSLFPVRAYQYEARRTKGAGDGRRPGNRPGHRAEVGRGGRGRGGQLPPQNREGAEDTRARIREDGAATRRAIQADVGDLGCGAQAGGRKHRRAQLARHPGQQRRHRKARAVSGRHRSRITGGHPGQYDGAVLPDQAFVRHWPRASCRAR